MTLDISKHKIILIKILKDIYADSTISSLLGFKGGTAAYLLYSLNRFSVDLDFDLLDEDQGDYVFNQVEKIISQYGKVKTKTKKRFTYFLELSYADADHNIKVEINRRNFGSKYELATYLGISIKVMVKEDMVADKLVAMYERKGHTHRDIFDVWFFLQDNWPINKALVEKRTNLSFKKLLKECIIILEKLPDRRILDGIGELLDLKQKSWAKAKLRTETIFLLKLLLNNEA
jgi:predicted nucleotidyltransferase component of viral defense system